MRVAIVHDWLYVIGGAERVLGELLRCYPDADVFTLFDVLDDAERTSLGFEHAHTTFLQHVPRIEALHRSLLPLMPLAIEQLDMSGYDLVISSSFAVAKGVITGPDQVHVAYVHSPMRYAWDMQHQYLRELGGLGLKRTMARLLLHRLRVWDSCSALRPNRLVANSAYIARRIRNVYGRTADVIYPPVDVTPVASDVPRGNYFLSAGRLVGYKNVNAIVEAFRLLPEQRLVVAGTGPEADALRSHAGDNVSFTGYVSDIEMRRLMAGARGLVFAANEDFGIVPVEAQAEGTPVIALGHGGACESVAATGPRPTGVFFDQPHPAAIAGAINEMLARSEAFRPEACQAQAALFTAERFRTSFKDLVDNEMEHAGARTPAPALGAPRALAEHIG
jgi:glycosyltransferase involved in cell wall biosynthesis